MRRFLNTLVCPAPAKINLFLHITGQRDDGLHTLETAFQFLEFSDTLKFSLTRDSSVSRLDMHDFDLPREDLIIGAVNLLRHQYPDKSESGVRITLHKNIPPGAGMGGGSSNAATTLLAMNVLWGLDLSQSRLLELAAALGADVPAFIYGRACWATGIGDRLRELDITENWYCFCIPRVLVSTARVFQHPDLVREHPSITPQQIDDGLTANVMQPVTCKLYPEVARALDAMSKFGPARMNGSGSSVFLQCASKSDARAIAEALPSDLNPMVTRSINIHPGLQ